MAPVGYVLQDVVADAMTVEAVPVVDERGQPIPDDTIKAMHTTMQTLGRVAIIGGGILVAAANVFLFRDAAALPEQAKAALYADVYLFALLIPLVSVAGVVLASVLRRHEAAGLARQGLDAAAIARAQAVHGDEPTRPNWLILGGSLVFVLVTLVVGTSDFPWAQETIFAASFVIVMVLLARLARELAPDKREVLVATALVLFVYRAVPGTGAGTTWWMIDELGFDQAFIARLSLIGSVLTLAGMFVFRRFMAEKSIAQIIVILTLASSVLALPTIGMVYGLHHWTAAHTGGVLDARMIALIDTALESPLGQIAMIPMLAWIANSAPANLKATYFAVMASFANLALSAAQLGTRYLNEVFVVSRAVKDRATGTVKIPADYSQVGELLIVATLIGLVVPLTAVLAVRMLRLRTA
jgi:hypothetical protein